MKKVTILLSVFALVMGLSQCRKPSFSALNGGETQHVVLSANNGNDGSKVSVSLGKTMDLKWEENDKIKVSGGLEGTLTLVSGAGTPTATFEGYATRRTGDVVFTYGGDPVFTGQTGTQEFVKEKICLEGKDVYKADGNYDVLMKVPYAVLKLDLSKFADTKTDEGVTVTIKGGAEDVTVIGVTAGSKELYVAMPAEEEESVTAKTYTFSGNGKVATVKNWPLKTNTFYTSNAETGTAIMIEPTSSPELLPGKFSVSATDYVQFSRGNLQATYNGSGYDWGFAANQYDYIGNAAGNTTIDSQADNAVVDLFGWSTATTIYGINISTSNGSYSGDFRDWGTAPGLPSAGEGKSWRTLSKAEWDYLLNSRDDATSLRDWKDFGSGIKGLVILPDGTDASVMESIASVSDLATYNAVFLPAAGKRNGTTMEKVGEEGFYWPSTPNGSEYAYGVYFSSYGAGTGASDRYFGYSVRLVQRFEKSEVKIGNLYWATMNVGATTVAGDPNTCFGDYFAWGDVQPRYTGITRSVDAVTGNIVNTVTGWSASYPGGYNSQTYSGTSLDSSHDAATQNWGGNWRTPTIAEYKSLWQACTGNTTFSQQPTNLPETITTGGVYWLSSTQTYLPEYQGVPGILFVDMSNTNNRVFFPAAGEAVNTVAYNTGFCYYWSSTYYNNPTALSFHYYSNQAAITDTGDMAYFGFSIRPVHD